MDPAIKDNGVDLEQHPTARKLVDRCRDLFSEIENLTPGHELEAHMNEHYGPSNPIYQDLCKFTLQGLEEGWVAGHAIPGYGSHYRKSQIALPCPENRYLSITTVYMDPRKEGDDMVFSGKHHSHPYGEINCVVQIDETAELKGMQGWQGAGWTSPGAGTHHFPQTRGGRLVALFFLPAGRISYLAKPEDPQPHCQ